MNLLVRLASLLAQSAPPGAVDPVPLEPIITASARLQRVADGLREYFEILSTSRIYPRDVKPGELLRDVTGVPEALARAA